MTRKEATRASKVTHILVPCPFCKKVPKVTHMSGVWREHYKVCCGTPGCYGNNEVHFWPTEKEAVAEWDLLRK